MQGFFAITDNRISVLIELLLCIRFRVHVAVRELRVELNRPIGWAHVVLNYFGPNAGIKVYYNGTEVGSDTPSSTSAYPRSTGEGRIVLGRIKPDGDYWYTSLELDELSYFNKALNTTEIAAMYNAV